MIDQGLTVWVWIAVLLPLAVFFLTVGISLFYTRTMKPLLYGFGFSVIWTIIVMVLMFLARQEGADV
ncbi:MAG: hypothetical protein A2945_00955 [Candidatus Liptonbacteria bacterium RIFCSPLOWO2_01_FULL_52_25]|uniref:Uncharacterized protein n=1 Tax=Candidatus Liptonbacteria bacterium RIFCSPLOWO2_01_FULL_52_25 TaxID=1798650 RepID=A0A1G2CF80_9BACT|nr:MAG: hypothetical protein A2945_00955 [Candidatus Liptonbacteria bacterium RIFCSPLOWO2_01_FULL_52_25]